MSDTICPLFLTSRKGRPVSNYFNSLPLRTQLQELGKCRFMDPAEFEAGVAAANARLARSERVERVILW